MAGKTDEARADLARLAIIRKQREEATKKKEAQKGMALGCQFIYYMKVFWAGCTYFDS